MLEGTPPGVTIQILIPLTTSIMVSMLHGEWAGDGVLVSALVLEAGVIHGGETLGSTHSGMEVTGVRPTLMEATGM